jgi:O-antigen/teichoic acid export membrane protein
MMGRRVLLLFVRTAIAGLMSMLATAVVARLMGAEALGTIGYLMGLVGVLSIASDLGYSSAYVRRISGKEDIAQDIGTFASVKLILAFLLALAIVITPNVNKYLTDALIKPSHLGPYYLIGVFYVSGVLASIFLRTFAARLEAAKLTVVGLVGSLLLVTVRIMSAWQGWGTIGLAAAIALQGVSFFVVGMLLFRGYRIGPPSLSLLRDYTSYAWPQMVLMIISSLAGNVDRAMLGRLGGAVEVGYYVGGIGVLTLANQLVHEAMLLFFPRVSQDATLADFDSMRNRLKGALKYLLLVIVPLVAATIIMREWWVRFYLGANFLAATPVIAVFALTMIPGTISRPYRKVLFAVERHRYLLVVQALGLAVLLTACGLLIPTSLFGLPAAGLGAAGAALAVLLKEIVECFCLVVLSARYSGIGFWRDILWFPVAGAVMVAIGLAIPRLIGQSSLAVLLSATMVALGAYLLTLVVVGQLRRAELTLLLNVIHPLRMLEYIKEELQTRDYTSAQYPDGAEKRRAE